MAETMPEQGTIIVTGGSRGIGAATCIGAAAQGYSVCVNYQGRKDRADTVVADIIEAGGRAIAIQADIGNRDEIPGLFDAAEAAFGPVKALVNNAGITGPLGRLDSFSAAEIARTIEVNTTGAIICAAEAVRRMSTLHGGTGGGIVNVSSAAARIGGAHEWVDYAASKGAIDTLTIGLAVEVATEGIRVNAVRPGLIDTEIHNAVGANNRMETMTPNIPMQRAASPEEVANTILWLLSDEASYVSGALLDVAGGR